MAFLVFAHFHCYCYAGNDILLSFYTLRMKAFLEFFFSLKTNAGKESLNMIFSLLFVGNYLYIFIAFLYFISNSCRSFAYVFVFLMTNETTK